MYIYASYPDKILYFCIYINFFGAKPFPLCSGLPGFGNPHPPRKCRRNLAPPLAAVDGSAAPKVRARLVKRGKECEKIIYFPESATYRFP